MTNYDARIYDIVRPGTFAGDLDWYRQKAVESRGPVLELGAGTGRITIPIAEAGIEVTALDVSGNMLARLREKAAALAPDVQSRISIHQGDMRSFALRQKYALVIIPFRAFLHNLTDDDQLAALRCAHEHLHDAGELALNVFHPSLEYMSAYAGPNAGTWRMRETYDIPSGGTVLISEATRYDTVHRRLHSLLRSDELDTAGMLVRTHVMRLELAYLYPADMKRLLDEAGFDLIRMSGDFNGRPFERDGDELVFEARKR